MTVSLHLSDAYCHIKIAASMADDREQYEIENECLQAMARIISVAIELGLDCEPWTVPDDLAD